MDRDESQRRVSPPADLRIAGVAHLQAGDPRMAALVYQVGVCRLPKRRGRYAALVRAIVGQQVSVKAAYSVYEKLRAAAGGYVTPGRVAALSAIHLRECGLSRQKSGYIQDLTAHVLELRLHLGRMHTMGDERVIEELTAVKGIGAWSAQMFLMFVLNRPDVLPTGDLGIQEGCKRIYRLRERPGPERMEALAAPWRPYRTVACWYLWRSLETPPQVGR